MPEIQSNMANPSASASPLMDLPSELVHHVLSHLPPLDLISMSSVNRKLNTHCSRDSLWQALLPVEIPKIATPPSPATTWREIYKQHHPYWFLVKNKIWFADTTHTGRLIVVRYDHRIDVIEAYTLVAERGKPEFQTWSHYPDAVIHTFNPHVQLDLNAPMLRLDNVAYSSAFPNTVPQHRLQSEITMDITHTGHRSAAIYSTFSLTVPWPNSLTTQATPIWPPLILPSNQRTRNDASPSGFHQASQKPSIQEELSTSTFRLRKWMEFSSRPLGASMRIGEDISTYGTLPTSCYTPTRQKPWQGIWCGDYAGHGCEFLVVLQPDAHEECPLPEKAEWALREREMGSSVSSAGSWSTVSTETSVDASTDSSDADGHGEIQSADDLENSVATLQAAYHVSQSASTHQVPSTDQEDDVYKGRIEAIKLTGDPNIPRGEYTFIAPDIGPAGLLRIADEDTFKGARIVKSVGHIAARGFRDENYITSQLILISHNRLAQYWETFGHVSFYERVDIDALTRL